MTYLSIWTQGIHCSDNKNSPDFGLFPDPIEKSLLVPVQQSRPSFSSGNLVMHLSCLTTVLSLPLFSFFLHYRELLENHIGSARTPSLRFFCSFSSAFNHLRYCVAILQEFNLSVPLSRWLNLHSLCWLSLGRLRSMLWRRDGTTITTSMRRGIQTTGNKAP